MAAIGLGLLFCLIRLGRGLPSSLLTVHPRKALVELGGSIQLTCSMDCPGGKFQWEGLDTDQGNVFSNDTHSILTIARATVSMEGEKFCTGQCRGASDQKKVELLVYSFPDALQLDSEPKALRAGQPARLVCSLGKVYPPGALTLSWFQGEERLEATKDEEDMEDSEEQLMSYLSVLEVPAAVEGASYKCAVTLEVEPDTFHQSRVAIVNPPTTQVPSTTEESTFALVTESTSRVPTPEPAVTTLAAITSGPPLLSPTEHPTTAATLTASPTPEPLPEMSSPSPTRNPVAEVQTSSQTGANTTQVPASTSPPLAETSAELQATSQAPHLTEGPPTTAGSRTRIATKKPQSSTPTNPFKDPCHPVITAAPTQGNTGDTLRITCLAAGCSKVVQLQWVETPVAKSQYRQEDHEGRSTLVVESVSLKHQGVYRCVAIASQPRIASLQVSIVPNAMFNTDSVIAIGTTGSLLGVVITGYVARRLWRRGG